MRKGKITGEERIREDLEEGEKKEGNGRRIGGRSTRTKEMSMVTVQRKEDEEEEE